ncbi:hypothetical protein QRX60_05425 [Amycolatopsis mongoliensis]|uniref:Zinc-finger domain-containing protein n=1 Tax=Amycolatopsis mongoliensis TaxID=715475 RepID=A0A9Y2NF10_9PSEU|nr:hypothetical protein [Amycolatopsis sp. 4-36]WIY03301.1 hypothetical protein QRX60_05425 [Amycolatopsis sp. 4-36]
MRGRHRDAAAYELGVLDDPEEFETHLRDCPRCRDLLTGFHPVSAALGEAARLGYLPGGGSPGGGPPVAGGSADAGSPASGPPAFGGSPAAGDPAPGGSARQRSGVAVPGYPPPSDGAARRRKPCVFTGRRGPAIGMLLLFALGVAVTIGCAARPATARTWFASAASIVSPAQVVAGTGHDLRDLPWSAGFQ